MSPESKRTPPQDVFYGKPSLLPELVPDVVVRAVVRPARQERVRPRNQERIEIREDIVGPACGDCGRDMNWSPTLKMYVCNAPICT